MKRSILILFFILFPALALAGEYNRADWPHWRDLDSDCQDARAETLIRDSLVPVVFESEAECRVTVGKWLCPYTGRTFIDDDRIDIDHMVPLENAHENGAEFWTREQRRVFANDPENLFSVYLGANRSKGSRGPEEWRPPMRSCWPAYARAWMHIKEKYGLGYAPGELEALGEMLGEK